MSFYGEIINTGESPFVFDKIYSSRYHMEKSMASDGIYAGRFVLVSYDSSYTHNDFKRAYIKNEDTGFNKVNINLYKDSDCTQAIKYKDFETDIEAAGEESAAALTEVYYVTDGYSYTYYKCSGKNNGIALFDYYLEMNSLFNQAYRKSSDSNSSLTIPLYSDSECTEPLTKKTIDSTQGVAIGDVVFVEETVNELSEKEQEQGLFSYYECTAESQDNPGVMLFKQLTTTTGHYQDETLENYIFNQKLDAVYFGLGGGVHNYDKTVWQKVYIGEKEKYIKVATLNSNFPKINLTVNPPETTMMQAPYFDTDVNGAVEDLHLQQTWGLRVGAANKALSTKGSWKNPVSGNYVNYEEGIKNALEKHIRSISLARESREQECLKTFIRVSEDDSSTENVTGNAYASLVTSLNEIFSDTSWASLENIANIRTDIMDYISLENNNVFKDSYNNYNTSYLEWFEVQDDPDYAFGMIELKDYYKHEYNGFADYLELNLAEQDPEANPSEAGWFIKENESYIESVDTYIDSNKTYYIYSDNILLLELKKIFTNNGVDVSIIGDENFEDFFAPFETYFSSLAAANGIYDLNIYIFFWEAYGQIRDILQTIFDLSIENPLNEEDYNPELLQEVIFYPQTFPQYLPVDVTEYDVNLTVPSAEGWYIIDNNEYVKTLDAYIDPNQNYYILYELKNLDEAVEENYSQILSLIEEQGEIKSDTNIIWNALTPEGEVYNFNGEEWVTESTTLPADIYYNKAGFDYRVDSKENEMIDEISITPTGFSQIYDEANDIWVNREFADPRSNYTNKTIECPDTHEISIHLPSVGNTISEVWDLVYGKGDKNNNNQRKTNIAWNQSSNDRTRLIHETNNGGYTHSKDEMATIAGAINTAQDLMGRIIIEDINDLSTIDSFDNFVDSDENPISKSSYIENNLNPDNIYYLSQDEKYYKVVSDYDFENIDSSKIIGNETDYYNLVRGYTSVDLMDPNNLDSNYYYLDTLNNEYVYNKNYLKNMSYWTLTATQVDFQINSFFVLNVGDDKSLFLSSEYEDGRYYDFKTSGPYSDILTNKYMFIPGEFYTYDSTTNRFIPAQKFIPVNTYYLPYTSNILSEDPLTNETIYGTVKFVQVYTPSGLDVNEIGTIVVREESSLDLEWFAEFPAYNPDAYICACFIKSTDLNKIPTYLNDKVSYYDAETKTSGDPHVKYHYINSLPEANLTYSVKPTVASGTTAQDGSALVAQQGDNIVCAILQIKFISEDYLSEGSYQPNTYYYKENSGYENIYNYKLETNARYDKEKTYYELQASRIYPLVYEKGIYYEKINDNNYILSTGDYSSSADYYEHNTYYVTNNHRSHTVGEIWDANIPWSEPLTDGSGQQLYEEVTTITNNNPQSDGLYEKNGNNFILTTDTSIIELYEQINLTSSSYQTNTYYILETDRYSLSSNNFNANETYYKLVDIYKPIVLTENSYQTNTYYIINDQNEYEITTDPFSEEQQYYKYIGQEYQEIILTSSDYTTNTYYVLLPDRYVLSSDNFSNTQTYYEKVNKKYYKPIINDYSSIIINSQLVSKNDLKLVYDLQELNSFGRQYNTVNGLILKLNQLIGEQTASDRNLNTIYGTLRRLNDEINRLSLYKTSTINDIVTAINACYDESVEITDQLIDLRNQALGVYGGLLTEDEANYYYTSNSDISTILGFDLKNNSQRKKQDILYLYDSDNMVLGTENGQYESFVSVLGTTYYKMHDSSSPSGFKQGYLSQNIGFEEINLTVETYEENKYYIISNSKVFVKANGAFDINKTYYQISSDITDNNGQFIPQPETEFGIRTKSNFTTMPQLFKNSSALITAPRSVLNEIDHKVNIEAYQADIGKIPQGMSMTPENVVLGEEPENTENHVYPKGSILYRIEDLEQAAKDIEEVLYGNGLGDSTFNLNGNWIIGDAPLGYVTLDIPLNFYCNDNKNIMYTHLTVTNDIVKYSNETTGDTATVYRNSQWTDPAYQKITIGEVSSGEVSSETETTTSETENNSKSNDYTAVKVTDNLYIWLTNKASYCGKVANVWTVIPTGVEANPNSGSIFKPGSAAIEELKKHNPQGILARLTALDTDINSLPSTADYSEALKNSLTEIKQSVQLELTGSTASSDTGVAASKGLTALTVDSKYGFSLLQAKTSIYKYNAATGETTYDYNIRIAFRPPAALAAFEAPFLQVDGMQLFEGAQKLNIIGDASTNPNLDAEIGIDGKIYFRSSKTWSPVTGASAYTFLLSGHLVEITKDDKVEQNRITFSPPTGTVQKMCNFKTSVAVSWTPENPAFTVPASPTLANHTFIGWMSSDSKVLITPSDLGGGRDLTPVHAKWKDVFKEDGSGLKCSSTFYPVFRPANNLRFISINGTTYWVDPTTTTIYKFIQSYAKSQLVLFYVATKKDKKGNPTQVRDCLTLRSYLKSKKKNKKTVYYINANTYHYKYWAAKKKGAQSGYYGQTLQTIFSKKTEGQFANYKLDYYIAGAPANKLNTKKIDPVYLII